LRTAAPCSTTRWLAWSRRARRAAPRSRAAAASGSRAPRLRRRAPRPSLRRGAPARCALTHAATAARAPQAAATQLLSRSAPNGDSFALRRRAPHAAGPVRLGALRSAPFAALLPSDGVVEQARAARARSAQRVPFAASCARRPLRSLQPPRRCCPPALTAF
jgi:hypothetical protein